MLEMGNKGDKEREKHVIHEHFLKQKHVYALLIVERENV